MNMRIVAIAAAALIAGCNTMHGVGQDISAGGQKVEDVLKKKPATETNGSNANTPATSNPVTTPEPATSGAGTDRSGRAPDTSMSTQPSGTSTQ